MSLKVTDVNLDQQYEYGGVAISAGRKVNEAFLERDPEKFAERINNHPDASRWSPEAKREAVDLLLSGDNDEDDIREALLKILSTIRDPEELKKVFPDNGVALGTFLEGTDEGERASAKVAEIEKRLAPGRVVVGEDVVNRLESAAKSLETVLEMLSDPAFPQEIKDALLQHYGRPEDIQKAVDQFKKWARKAEDIDLSGELEQIGAQLKEAEFIIADGDGVLLRAEREYKRKQSTTPASAEGEYERPPYARQESTEEVRTKEDELLDKKPEELLALLDSGQLKAKDLTPAVQLKIQREMNQQSMMQNLVSNLLNVRHEMNMAAIRNLKA